LLWTAEVEPGLSTCFLRIVPSGDQVVSVLLKMELHLLFELLLHLLAVP
jgi:hypothetical protein